MAGIEHTNHLLLAALRHPLRRRILRLMVDGEALSPSQLAETLNESLSSVSYHVRVLAECGALVSAGEKPVRGATQHFYRWALEADWAKTMLGESDE